MTLSCLAEKKGTSHHQRTNMLSFGQEQHISYCWNHMDSDRPREDHCFPWGRPASGSQDSL